MQEGSKLQTHDAQDWIVFALGEIFLITKWAHQLPANWSPRAGDVTLTIIGSKVQYDFDPLRNIPIAYRAPLEPFAGLVIQAPEQGLPDRCFTCSVSSKPRLRCVDPLHEVKSRFTGEVKRPLTFE